VLLDRFGYPTISLSETFEDGPALLRVAEERGLWGFLFQRADLGRARPPNAGL
jgi:hypothetical protein